jgi:hypothetical protein
MQSALAMQDAPGLSPAWLRPGALALVTGIHLAVFLGVPWPGGAPIPQPAPVEIEVIPPAEPVVPLLERTKVQALEVKPTPALKLDTPAAELQPLAHGRTSAEIKPQEPAFATNAPPAATPSAQERPAELKAVEAPRPVASEQTALAVSQATRPSKLPVRPADAPPPRPASKPEAAEAPPLQASRPAPKAAASGRAREAGGSGAPLPPAEAAQPLSPSGEHLADARPLDASRPVIPAQASGQAREAVGGAAQAQPAEPPHPASPLGETQTPAIENSPPATLTAREPQAPEASVPPVVSGLVPPSPGVLEAQPLAASQPAAPVQGPSVARVSSSAAAALPAEPPRPPAPSNERPGDLPQLETAPRPPAKAEPTPLAREASGAPAALPEAKAAQDVRPASEPRIAKLELPAAPSVALSDGSRPAREAGGPSAAVPEAKAPDARLGSEQRVAKLELPPAPSVAVTEGSRPARETSGPPTTLPAAKAAPDARPASEQRIAKLEPSPAPSAVQAEGGRPAHELSPAGSPVVAGTPPGRVPGAAGNQQVAEIRPFSGMQGPPLHDQGPQRPERIEKIVRYVEQYDGGDCFYVASTAVTETRAELEGYGLSDKPFYALQDAFLHENGYEPGIDVRLVTPAQCPTVAFLGRLRGVSAPPLRIDGARLGPGKPLTGAVDGRDGWNVALLLVTDSGAVQDVSRLLKPGGSGKSFTIGYRDISGAAANGSELLIAVATLRPFEALRFDGPVAAADLFPALLAEGLRTNQPVAAMARYFKIEP